VADVVTTGRVLGLDIGTRRIGVALSDPGRVLASPLTLIEPSDQATAIQAICHLVRQHEVGRIVVGMPYSLDGTVGQQARRVLDFVAALSQQAGVPVEAWDERLTTVIAERRIAEAHVRRGKRRGLVDAAAAAVILQGYLDSQWSE